MSVMIDKVKALALKYEPEIVAVRRHLHKNPELSFQEFETAQYITSKLGEYGIPFKKGIAGTGIIAWIEGKNPKSRIIGLRADMDGLPVVEKNDLDFKSVVNGKMHACGHDVHVSCLLGTARILYDLKSELNGTVMLIFQPAEEKIPGGAKLMIEAGAFDEMKPEVIIGQHVMPSMKVGTVGFCKGMYMASADEIYITVNGKGGHAAMPDQITDQVLIAARIIDSLQAIVSRFAPPSVPTVLSFGKFIANGANNIIPDEVKIDGTFRSMNEEWRDEAHIKIEKIAKSIAESMGAECEVEILKGYPVLVNDDDVTEKAEKASIAFLGSENVETLEKRMTSEDFAYYSTICPTTFYRMGTGNEQEGTDFPLHSPFFKVDEKSIRIAMGNLAWIALKFLG